jgi:hypothetical protein
MSVRHWAKDCLIAWNRESVDSGQFQAMARGFEVLGQLVDGPDGSVLTDDVAVAARREAQAPLSVADWRQRIRQREALSDTFKRFGGASEKLLFARLGWTQVSSGHAVLALPDAPWTRAAIRALRLIGRFEEASWTAVLEGNANSWIAPETLHPPLRAAPACRKRMRRGHLHTWPASEADPRLPALLVS